MKISKKQAAFLRQSKSSRINILEGAVRSGKTHVLFLKIIRLAVEGPDGKGAIVAKTLETLRENVLDPLKEMLGGSMRYSDAGRRIEIGGRRIRGVGANDEKSSSKIQGDTLAWAVGDEVTLWPESFFKMLLSRLSVHGAQLFASCNPDSPYHWLKRDFIDRAGEIDCSTFHFGIDDNPFLDQDYVAHIKAEFTGLWYKRYIDGLWVMADGAVYDMWDDALNITDVGYRQFQNYIAAVDYGTSNPCTFGLYGWDDPAEIVLVKEYYWDSREEGRQKTDAQYIDDLKIFLDGINYKIVYIDPSAASFILEAQRNGIRTADAENQVLPGIAFVSNLISRGRFKVDRRCTNTLREITAYSWDKAAQRRGEDKPLKEHDHCMDRDRYALYSHFGAAQEIFIA